MTIITLMSEVASLTRNLEKMQISSLIGFERSLDKQISTGLNGEKQLKGIELKQMEDTRRPTTSFVELRKEILISLREFLENRFVADDAFVKMIEPFLRFTANADIEAIHAAIAPDLNLPNLSLQFQDIASDPKVYEGLSLLELIVKRETCVRYWRNPLQSETFVYLTK